MGFLEHMFPKFGEQYIEESISIQLMRDLQQDRVKLSHFEWHPKDF